MEITNHSVWIVILFKKFFDYPLIKIFVAMVLSCVGFLFDGLLREAMLALLILLIFDFVTGIAAAKREGNEINSHTAFRTAVKIAIYFLLVSSGRMAEVATRSTLPFIDEAVIAFLGVTELISILENVGRLGYAIPLKLLNKLKSYRDNSNHN